MEWGDVFDAAPYAIAGVVGVAIYLYGGYALFMVNHDTSYALYEMDDVKFACSLWFLGISAMLCVFVPLIAFEVLKNKYQHKRIVTCKKEK